MATGYKTCKVCGEKYEYCMTNRPSTVFRWQDVACSPEHGSIYFLQIAESRGESIPGAVAIEVPTDDSASALFEEDFEDGEEEMDIEI